MEIEDGVVFIDVRNGDAIVSRYRAHGSGFHIQPAANWRELEGIAAEMVEDLGGSLSMSNHYHLPAHYPFANAEWDVPQADWITLREAADLAGVSSQAISNAIEAGRLDWRGDNEIARRREGRRQVRRSQVEKLKWKREWSNDDER